MRRVDLQKLAQAKFDDASLLLESGRYSNAYYLAGYAVELALKACIARQIRAEEIPTKQLIDKVFTHKFANLIGLAGLAVELQKAQDHDHQFQAYWGVASEWSPETRYDIQDSMSAQLLLQAIGDHNHGVLKWIRTYW